VKPKIYLLSRPHFDVDIFLSFLRDEGMDRQDWHRTPQATPSEEIVEVSGRVCYMSFGQKQSPRSNPEYLRNLLEKGHESVLEHVSWTFLLTGVSRAFTHQLVRHRVGLAFSQLSQQYHEETAAAFVQPAYLDNSPSALQVWRDAVAASQQSYKTILDNLVKTQGSSGLDLSKRELNRAIRSAARSVLPNATETKIMMTANARALRHIFQVRGSIPGDFEMREVMAELFRLVQSEAPSLFADFSIEILPDGIPTVIRQERRINNEP
jgi:thymidylate synthase (FAD)